MAAALHDHIHLFAYTNETQLNTSQQEACSYGLLLPGMDVKLDTAAAVERGLTGVPHVYRTLNNGGNPLTFHNGVLQIMASPAQLNSLVGLSGKHCYLILNMHDDDSGGYCPIDTANGYHVLATTTTYRMIDPQFNWWTVWINITDLT